MHKFCVDGVNEPQVMTAMTKLKMMNNFCMSAWLAFPDLVL